ncbi:uncharacterized protein BDV14DRAFT_201682 [Aspergillus stella-maris]|uniref:uncharacterized protein n=1 Tax=Aspergillus stella-maris TaxID=1810926 RepID=UPI003CCC97D9
MKLLSTFAIGLFVSNALGARITTLMKGGDTNDVEVATDGVCIDLFQGAYAARLSRGPEGAKCLFWVDSGCTGDWIGEISTGSIETDLSEGANGIKCVLA